MADLMSGYTSLFSPQSYGVKPASAPATTVSAPFDLKSGAAYSFVPPASNIPPAPKSTNANLAPVPTYSFLDGSKYSASGKQMSPPTIVTAKAATTDLANKQAGLEQATQAQAQQTQNVATQQATVTATPPPTTAPAATADDLNNIINGTAGQQGAKGANDAIAGVNQQADAAFQSFNNAIKQIQNGTFPLTPSQQSQVNATQSSFNQLKEAQDIANQNYEGQVALAGVTEGINQTAPQIQLGLVHSAVSSGIQKIADIDSQASKAVADLQQGFMDKDYEMINNAYSAATNLFHDKSQAIQQMNDNVRNATNDALALHKQQMDEAQQQLENQQANIKFATDNGITQPYYLSGSTAIDTKTGLPVSLEQYQKATGQPVGQQYQDTTDFSKIQHIEDPTVANLRNKYPDAGILSTDTPDQATAKLKDSALYYKDIYIAPPAGSGGIGGSITTTDANGNTINIPTDVAPYFNQTSDGIGWVDASTLQGTAAQKRNIVNQAQAFGAKVITNKNEAADLTNILNVQNNLQTVGTVMQGIDQPGWVQRAEGGAGLTKFQELAQSDPQKAAAGALSSIGLDVLKAISGIQGFRGNNTAIQQVKDHLPTIYDTNDTVQAKIKFINDLINNRQSAILGVSNQSQTPTTTASGKPFDVQAAKTAGYTDQEIQDYLKAN